MADTSEKRERLWLLAAPPALWALHFLLSYGAAAVWCARVVGPGGTLLPIRVTIAILTVLALGGIGLLGWSGARRRQRAGIDAPHSSDSDEDRHRFIGFATLLLASLSAVAVVYSAMVPLFVEDCR